VRLPAGAVDTLVPAHVGADAQAVVREAVNNTVRHGRSTAVTLTVDAGDEVVIEVVDNGIRILAGAARSGLRNLDDRGPRVRWSARRAPRAVRRDPA
jgi:signal transduction histidine kinase